MRKHYAFLAAAMAVGSANADVTGAYGRATNSGSMDTYAIVVQRGDTILVTLNIIKMTQPGIFGGTQKTNIFAYGLGTLNASTQTARITLSSFTEGACYSIVDLHFGGGTMTKTGVGGTCTPNTSPAETFNLAF